MTPADEGGATAALAGSGGAAPAPAPLQPTAASSAATSAAAAAAKAAAHPLPAKSGGRASSSGGGAGLVRLIAAAFSGGSEGASGPSPRIRAGGFDSGGGYGGGYGGAGSTGSGSGGGVPGPATAAAGRSRTPPLLTEAAAPPPAADGASAGGASAFGGPSSYYGSLGGVSEAAATTTDTEPQQQQQQHEQQQPQQPPPRPPFWRLGAPPEGRGARFERHGAGPAGGPAPGPTGPWGVRGTPGPGGETASLDYFPRVGVRTFTDGVRGASRAAHGDDSDALTPLGRAVAVVTLLAYVGWGHCLLALMFACVFARSLWPPLILAAALATLWLPAAPLYVRSIHLGPLMRCWRRYFRFSYVFDARLDASRPYVVAQFPHGAFPLGQIMGGSFMACEFEQHTLLALAASAVFAVPGWRHVNSWFGALPATSHNFRRLLRRCVRAARGELLAEEARAETEAIEAGAREAAAAAAAAEEAEVVARAAEQQLQQQQQQGTPSPTADQRQQQQRQQGSTPRPTAGQRQHLRSPSPHRRGAACRPVSAPPPSGPFSFPGAAVRPLLSDLAGPGASAGLSAAAAAASPLAGGGGGLGLRRLEATVSAPPVPLRNPDVERAAMLARLRRADSILSDPGGRALAGRGLSDDESETGSGSGGDGGGGGSGSEEVSSDPSVILVGTSPVLVEEAEEEEQEEEEQQKEQQQRQQGLRRRRRNTAAAASNGGGNSDPEKLRPGSPSPGSPRAADPAAPDSPRAPSSSSRPATAGHHPHHLHHAPVPVPADLLPPGAASSGAAAPGEAGPAFPKHPHPGTSIAVMVGGIAEMYLLRRDAEVLKLRSRKGFVRLALEHGVDVLPTYVFGNSAILDFGPRWLKQASRRWRASFGLVYGPWGLPMPRRVPMMMAVGAPVAVGPPMAPTEPGFEARVDEVHAAVCQEIARVYYRWRAEYGWPDRPLIIA